MDCRLDMLTEWVAQQEEAEARVGGAGSIELEVVSGDASFRRYFRLKTKADTGDLIAVDAPPPQEDCKPFVSIAKTLLAAGVAVPEVFAVDYDQGFMLLSDFGDELLLDTLSLSNVEMLYGQALGCLPAIMSCMGESASNESSDQLKLRDQPKHYDRTKLLDEMQLFPDWFLTEYLEVNVDPKIMEPVFNLLVESALEQPQVFVHRDFHSRNLMITASGTLGVIDFQDAVVGPITYDIVSLLKDCYVAWPLSRVEACLVQSRKMLQQKGLLDSSIGQAQFRIWFDLMGAQRHLKAIGIFARLNCRDAKPGYLPDIPRTLRYLLDVCDEHIALNALAESIREVVLPALFEKNRLASQWFQETHCLEFESSDFEDE